MFRYIAIVLVLALLVLHRLRGRWGARLLGVSERVLDIIYIVALVVTGIIAALTEYWLLLGLTAALLALRGVEALRDRRRADGAGHDAARPAPRAKDGPGRSR